LAESLIKTGFVGLSSVVLVRFPPNFPKAPGILEPDANFSTSNEDTNEYFKKTCTPAQWLSDETLAALFLGVHGRSRWPIDVCSMMS
jgi:hypothetical protein